MNPRYVIHEEIDRYLNGQMAAAERRLFEAELASNASVRAEFEAQQLAHQVIMENSLLDLKKQMQRDMNGGGSTPPSSGTGKNYRNWIIGLGGLLCVSSLYYFYSNSESGPSNKAATTNSTSPPVAQQQSQVKKESSVIMPRMGCANVVIAPPVANQAEETQGGLTPVPLSPSGVTPVPHIGAAPESIPATAPVVTPATTPTPDLQERSVTPEATPNNSAEPAPDHAGNGDSHAKAYTFQPDVEGNWNLPYKENTKGTFKVISRSGVTVYQTSFSSGTTEWNGNDAAGVPLPGGYYIYLIEYEQGSAEKGSLTILR